MGRGEVIEESRGDGGDSARLRLARQMSASARRGGAELKEVELGDLVVEAPTAH